MYTVNDLINDFEQYKEWVVSLQRIEGKLFFEPIAEGKWSTAEIITHIAFWDEYIMAEMLPKMKQDADISSIDFDTLNQKASAYALSGISQQQVINEQVHKREELISRLKKIPHDDFSITFRINGEDIDQYSGYPNSIFNYFCSFVWHDNHHRRQVEEFLEKVEMLG
ncbi:DinB superfamily protein [Gracilibacillus ureilyticus]|uniref:DinB superfamily protein n=1 Tax=Gracilibacillus ureilyticus TaxID=531814 RepID=A0A1H9UYZ0_9BACI|nr:DinB family protein [Gracilibacillus ureilyticus]SES14334.1 DinB superfamily protein [Gracilibacillus ureilyticus]